MTIAGWITMIIVVGFMAGLMTWCSWKVATTPNSSEHIHPVELETPDMHEKDA